jgi:glycosyltransferase involved in cell wall biosynthesis
MSLALLLATELEHDISHGFEVFGLSAPGPYVDRVRALGVTHVPLPALTRAWNLRRDAAAFFDLVRTLRRLHLDVLHTHNPKTGVLGRIAGRLARVPVVVNTCHGLWVKPSDPLPRKAFVLGMESFAATFSHAELYQNSLDAEVLRRWAVPTRKQRVVGNGVDLERFRHSASARRALRHEWGVADDELLVGGVGRRVSEKGLPEFVAMARALRGKARFVWVGPPDPDKPDAFVNDVDGDVTFLDARDDMPAVYSALDVFVLPSHREGFSRSAMEAAACRTAMVLSDIRGCREIGRHEEEVLLVPAGSADELGQAVERLLADPGLREQLAVAAEARARRDFDQRAVANVSIATYVAVAGRRRLGWRDCEARNG